MHQFEQGLESSRKAFKINPNDPRVISVHGELLLRARKIEDGLRHLEKAYQLEPIPAGQTTSDKRLAALFLGHYLKDDFARCQEMIEGMVKIDNRTWLLNIDLHLQHEKNYLESDWFSKLKNNFSGLDWPMEIDRYHLNDKNLDERLSELAKSF